MIRSEKRLRICTVLLILNLIFIWGNSLLPAVRSLSISNWLRDLLGFDTGDLGGNSSHVIRKLAHFTEFGLLGALLRWLFGMLHRKPVRYLGIPLLAGVCAAIIDEGIQLFVPGRGSRLTDIGIDALGVLTGIGLLSLIYLISQTIRKNHVEEIIT